MLSEGDDLPNFSLKNTEGKTVSDEDIKKAVIYFYPKDNTPGCTKEACGFRDNINKYEKLGFEVYGVSKDDQKSHKKFTEKYDLNFSLLCDVEGELSNKFGVLGEKKMFGNTFMGITRSTFIIDNGKIIKAWPNVKPKGHAEEVMKFLEEYDG